MGEVGRGPGSGAHVRAPRWHAKVSHAHPHGGHAAQHASRAHPHMGLQHSKSESGGDRLPIAAVSHSLRRFTIETLCLIFKTSAGRRERTATACAQSKEF